MMDNKLSNAKIFGGIGAILAFVGLFFMPLLIVGIILIFVAVKYISDEVKDKDIFNNYLYSFILSIIAWIAIFVIFISTLGIIFGFSFFDPSQFTNFTDITYFEENFGLAIGGLVGCILAIIVGWILFILSALYLRKSYNGIAEHTKVDLFRTTGLVNFIGAVTLIIGIGFIIWIIARILEIASFFSLPDTLAKATETSKESSEGEKTDRRCPNCGRKIPEDARSCPNCNKKFY